MYYLFTVSEYQKKKQIESLVPDLDDMAEGPNLIPLTE